MEKEKLEFNDLTFRPLAVGFGGYFITNFDEDFVLELIDHKNWNIPQKAALLKSIVQTVNEALVPPVDMLIFCPVCHKQHIDQPEPDICVCGHLKFEHHWDSIDDVRLCKGGIGNCPCDVFKVAWDNPLHKSHTCRLDYGGCGNIFRVADFPTNGVAEIKTSGKSDTWTPGLNDRK